MDVRGFGMSLPIGKMAIPLRLLLAVAPSIGAIVLLGRRLRVGIAGVRGGSTRRNEATANVPFVAAAVLLVLSAATGVLLVMLGRHEGRCCERQTGERHGTQESVYFES
jgi:hypothetical protein